MASCGRTIDEAFEMIEEAVGLFLDGIEVAGERGRVFRRLGIRVIRDDQPSVRPAKVEAPLNSFISRRSLPIHSAAA